MSRPCFRRAAVLLLVLALAASWAAAEPRVRHESRTAAEPRAAGFLSTLWEALRAIWEENGCGLDPFGCTAPQGDNGCGADPFGCTAPQGDNGCHLDPNGCSQN